MWWVWGAAPCQELFSLHRQVQHQTGLLANPSQPTGPFAFGMQWQCSRPRSAPHIFSPVADTLEWIARRRGVDHIFQFCGTGHSTLKGVVPGSDPDPNLLSVGKSNRCWKDWRTSDRLDGPGNRIWQHWQWRCRFLLKNYNAWGICSAVCRVSAAVSGGSLNCWLVYSSMQAKWYGLEGYSVGERMTAWCRPTSMAIVLSV